LKNIKSKFRFICATCFESHKVNLNFNFIFLIGVLRIVARITSCVQQRKQPCNCCKIL